MFRELDERIVSSKNHPNRLRFDRAREFQRFYHGRYVLEGLDAYLDDSERRSKEAADRELKARLFPGQHAAGQAALARLARLRRDRPDLDLAGDERRTRALARLYVKRRLRAAADRRYAFRPLAETDVCEGFVDAVGAFVEEEG